MQHRALLLVRTAAALALAAVGWTGWLVYQVSTDLTAAQGLIVHLQGDLLKPAGTVDLPTTLARIEQRTDQAGNRTQSPFWSAAEHLPVLGGSFRAVRRTARTAQLLGDEALPQAVAALDLVHRGQPIHGGRVDLALLGKLGTPLARAAQAVDDAQALLAPRDSFVIGPVETRVATTRTQLARLDAGLRAAVTTLHQAPALLGANGPRRYFVAVQNNAEARATGGLVGGFAIVTADQGQITLEQSGIDSQLKGTKTAVASDSEAAGTWLTIGSTVAWQDANLTPHVPDAARNLAGLWAAQGGQPVDGVIALDPLVMSELLKASGGVHLPDGTSITAANVVDFVGRDEYTRYHGKDNGKRKMLLAALADNLFHAVVAARDPVRTLAAAARAGASGHLFVWSADPTEEAALAASLVGGALPRKDTPYLQVLTQNFGGNKLDFYLRRTVRVTRAADGLLRVQVTLRNTVPTGLPSIVAGRADLPDPPLPYGQNRLGFSVYGALSTAVRDVQIDGKPAPMAFDRDHGHQMGTLSLELPREQDVVVTLLVTEPAGDLVYRQQPLMVPDTLEIEVPHVVLGR